MTDEKDSPVVAALREALDEIREEYEAEDVVGVKAGLSIAYDAVRVVLNRHEQAIPPALRYEIERLADSFERQPYEEWSGEELAALMRGALRKTRVIPPGGESDG